MFTLPSIAGFFLGAALGAILAYRRKGSRLDMAHWAAVFALLGFLAGVVWTLVAAPPA